MTKEYIMNWEKLRGLNDYLIEESPVLAAYFDLDSQKNIGLKVRVYEAIKAGKKLEDIPGYMDIFDLLPKSDGKKDVHWD